jgi:hypothetical protein
MVSRQNKVGIIGFDYNGRYLVYPLQNKSGFKRLATFLLSNNVSLIKEDLVKVNKGNG